MLARSDERIRSARRGGGRRQELRHARVVLGREPDVEVEPERQRQLLAKVASERAPIDASHQLADEVPDR